MLSIQIFDPNRVYRNEFIKYGITGLLDSGKDVSEIVITDGPRTVVGSDLITPIAEDGVFSITGIRRKPATFPEGIYRLLYRQDGRDIGTSPRFSVRSSERPVPDALSDQPGREVTVTITDGHGRPRGSTPSNPIIPMDGNAGAIVKLEGDFTLVNWTDLSEVGIQVGSGLQKEVIIPSIPVVGSRTVALRAFLPELDERYSINVHFSDNTSLETDSQVRSKPPKMISRPKSPIRQPTESVPKIINPESVVKPQPAETLGPVPLVSMPKIRPPVTSVDEELQTKVQQPEPESNTGLLIGILGLGIAAFSLIRAMR